MPTKNLYIGWDVGTWICNDKSSCDSIAVMDDAKIYQTYRGNLSEGIIDIWAKQNCNILDLLKTWLDKCQFNQDLKDYKKITIGIDTPLGCPRLFKGLFSLVFNDRPRFYRSNSRAIDNSLIYRFTERKLGYCLARRKAKSPMSAITDSIGNQSTKGMIFLRSSGCVNAEWGVWEKNTEGVEIKIIETYPSPLKNSPQFLNWAKGLNIEGNHRPRNIKTEDDSFDAVICALAARAFLNKPELLQFPPTIEERPRYSLKYKEEGWIFYQKDIEEIFVKTEGIKTLISSSKLIYETREQQTSDNTLNVPRNFQRCLNVLIAKLKLNQLIASIKDREKNLKRSIKNTYNYELIEVSKLNNATLKKCEEQAKEVNLPNLENLIGELIESNRYIEQKFNSLQQGNP